MNFKADFLVRPASLTVATAWKLKSFNVHFCRGGKYTEDDAKTVLLQILNVVSFCHLQGVVHRDLKPEVLKKSILFVLFVVMFSWII